jgi:hypothetical protein
MKAKKFNIRGWFRKAKQRDLKTVQKAFVAFVRDQAPEGVAINIANLEHYLPRSISGFVRSWFDERDLRAGVVKPAKKKA